MKRLIVFAALVAVGLAVTPAHGASTLSAGQWDDETIQLFSEIPILDGGRVKPMDTYAQFVMLRINGMRSYRPLDADGNKTKRSEKLGPVEWLMDCLFHPEAAMDYPVFVVDDANTITTLGLERHDKQRDRYSYNELKEARRDLEGRAQSAMRVEQNDRTYQQNVIVALNAAVYEFEALVHFLDFARLELSVADSPLLQKVLDLEPDAHVTVADVFAHTKSLQNAALALRQVIQEGSANEERIQEEVTALENIFFPLDVAGNMAIAMRILPPSDAAIEEWPTPSDMVGTLEEEWNKPSSERGETPFGEAELAALAALDRMADTVDEPLAFKQNLQEFHAATVSSATERGEYAMVPLELAYYNSQLVYRAQIFFVFSFILAALSWLSLQNKWLNRATIVSVAVPLLMLITAITWRCIIRGRPPVSTLYETVLFITAVSVFVALFIEYVNRQKIALSVGAFLGALGLFIAGRYEITNQQDTMPSLVAVLDTNFWLATHVTIINIGYAAGMLAGGLAHVYILGRLFKYKKDDPKFYRSITRMVYGVTCFGLLFAFVGTVLGGIWANYSWGRFWGWDPKENGAALICICQLAILHARVGGYISQMGIHIAALFTGCVVGFSWWGVNLLGVGLHSYGFTVGIWNATYTFWGVEVVTMVLGFIVLFRDRKKPAAPEAVPVDDAEMIPAK